MPLIGIIIMAFLTFEGCYSEVYRSNRYEKLMTEVQDKYRTWGIILSTSTNSLNSFDLQEILHGVSRDSSNHQIFITRVDYGQLEERIEFCRHRIGRPMVIIIIRTEREILEFKESTEKIAMGFPVWMMIFSDADKDNRLCEFCHNPTTNPFRLENSTEFLVTCCSNRKLEEWWSKDGRTANVLPVGELINEKMQWVQTESEFHRRRKTVQLQLRVVTVQKSTSFWISDGVHLGFLGEFSTLLMNSMNFSIDPPVVVALSGNWNETESKWTGAMGMIQKGEVDLGFMLLTMRTECLDDIAFTIPLIKTHTSLFIKKPEFDGVVQWHAYFQIFNKKVWLTIVMIMCTASAVLTLIKYNPRRNSLWSVFSDSFLDVFGTFCQQGLSKFPLQTSLKVTYISVSLTSVVLLAAYSASVISILTAPRITLPFNNMEEFSNQKDYELIVMKRSAQYDMFVKSNDSVEAKMFKLMAPEERLPKNVPEMIRQICGKKVAFYGTIVHFPPHLPMPCKIIRIGNHVIMNLAMILPRDSPYIESINHQIIGSYNNGLLKYLKRKYYSFKEISLKAINNEVGFWDIVPILALLCGGILSSLFILFLEFKTAISSLSNH